MSSSLQFLVPLSEVFPPRLHARAAQRQRFQGKPDDAMTSMQVTSRVEESSGVRSGSAGSGGARGEKTTDGDHRV
ncbi:hypothetical protein SRHO_G00085440 [Serrasalmus rhombeus]